MSKKFTKYLSKRSNSVGHVSNERNGKVEQKTYRITVMGAAGVGKSCIISQFLQDKFLEEYKRTIEDMYRKNYKVDGKDIVLNILDTSGSYPFPAMRKLAISVSDALILVYTAGDNSSFEEVIRLREEILQIKQGIQIPTVIVANKADLKTKNPEVEMNAIEAMVCVEWENTFVQASAKDNYNITGIFSELMRQLDINLNFDNSPGRDRCSSMPSSRDRQKNREKTPT